MIIFDYSTDTSVCQAMSADLTLLRNSQKINHRLLDSAPRVCYNEGITEM